MATNDNFTLKSLFGGQNVLKVPSFVNSKTIGNSNNWSDEDGFIANNKYVVNAAEVYWGIAHERIDSLKESATEFPDQLETTGDIIQAIMYLLKLHDVIPTYTITLYAGQTDTSLWQSLTGQKGDTIIYPDQQGVAIPGRTGHDFSGWGIKNTDGSIMGIQSRDTVYEDNRQYYAMYSPKDYTVTFKVENTQYGDIITAKYNTQILAPEENPTKEHFDFQYWSKTQNGTEVKFPYTIPAENTIFYAVFKEILYNLVWNANGGAWSDSSTTQTTQSKYGELLSNHKPTTSPTKEGYTLSGWSTTANDTNTAIQTTTIVSGAGTYYALWDLRKLTITWNANGGSWSGTTTQTTTIDWGGSVDEYATKPTYTGRSLVGWNTSGTGTKLPFPQTGIKSDTTYKAIWSLNTYTVTFNYNYDGAPEPDSKTGNVTQNVLSLITTPERDGYEFVGWNTSATATTASVTSSTKVPANNTTVYYAIWKKLTLYYIYIGYEDPTGTTSISQDQITNKVPGTDVTPAELCGWRYIGTKPPTGYTKSNPLLDASVGWTLSNSLGYLYFVRPIEPTDDPLTLVNNLGESIWVDLDDIIEIDGIQYKGFRNSSRSKTFNYKICNSSGISL